MWITLLSYPPQAKSEINMNITTFKGQDNMVYNSMKYAIIITYVFIYLSTEMKCQSITEEHTHTTAFKHIYVTLFTVKIATVCIFINVNWKIQKEKSLILH